MSAPETKARPPAPLTTITRTASSRSKSSMIWVTACHMSSDTALWRAGLLKIRRPIGPSFSAIILLVMGWSSMALRAPDYWSDDIAGAQIGDCGVIVAEFVQYLVGVLAEVGCRAQLFGLGSAGHIDRLPHHLDWAELWMVDRPRHFEMLNLRIGKGLVDRVDRPTRNADLVHQLDPIGARTPHSDFGDPFVQRFTVLRALRPGRVIRIVEQCHRISRLAEAAKHMIARSSNVDLPVRGGEQPRWDAGRMIIAGLLRDLAGDQPARSLEIEHEDLRFEKRGMDPLPLATRLALDQSHQHRLSE